jgi:hypothetical protein
MARDVIRIRSYAVSGGFDSQLPMARSSAFT